MRRLAAALLLVTFACGTEPSPQARLRDDVERRVAAALPGAKFEPKDDLTLAVKLADGTEQEIRIDNLWHETEGATPEERELMIAQFVRAMVAGPAPAVGADRETKLKTIVPLVRDEAYVEEMRKVTPPASRPLVADLHVVYAYDGEESVTIVPLEDLKEIGLGPEELHQRAVENLNSLIGSEVKLVTVDRIWMVTCGGNYECSLLLADKLWTKLAERVKGDIIAGCPARDLLLFADGADPLGVAALKKMVDEEYAKGGRTISKRLLRRTAQGWTPVEQ